MQYHEIIDKSNQVDLSERPLHRYNDFSKNIVVKMVSLYKTDEKIVAVVKKL